MTDTSLARLPHAGGPSSSTATTPPRPAAFGELIELGVSYRQLDSWIRSGMIFLSSDANGSGTRRSISPMEAEAIKALIVELTAVEARTRFLRSGDFFEAKMNELTRRQEAASVGAS